jgi:hypothetical protein
MTRQCKICTSQLRSEVDELLLSYEYSAEYVSKYCNDKGLVVSPSTVRRHGTLHVTGYNPSQNTNEVRKLDKKPPKMLLIDFDEYLKSIGVDRKIVENVDEYFDENVTAYQKGINVLMFKTMTVLNEKLNVIMASEGKFPSDEIKSLKLMCDVFNRCMGIDKAIDENVAITHLESIGYDVRQNTIDI